MVERVAQSGAGIGLEPARGQVAARVDFGSQIAAGAQAALQVLGTAVSFVPGGAFVSAVAGAAAEGLSAVAGEGAVRGGDGAGGDERWALLRAQERLQQEGMANSLRLLSLQRRMQQETEAVHTVSNVMKTRHEMAKAAISNLRG